MPKIDPQQKALLAASITKAIAYTENGGAPNIQNPTAGKSGEMKSIFQYTPNTWHAVAAKYLGDANTPLTPDAETTATVRRVGDWLDKGYNTSQIASMWNAGEGRPNAYKENWKGTNSYGVQYDTPKYASTVLKYAKQFYADNSTSAVANAAGSNTSPQPQNGTVETSTPSSTVSTPSAPVQSPSAASSPLALRGLATLPSLAIAGK